MEVSVCSIASWKVLDPQWIDGVYSLSRKFYPLNLKDKVTKGIDKISHLVHFINLWSPVLGRITLRIFVKIPSKKPSEILSMVQTGIGRVPGVILPRI